MKNFLLQKKKKKKKKKKEKSVIEKQNKGQEICDGKLQYIKELGYSNKTIKKKTMLRRKIQRINCMCVCSSFQLKYIWCFLSVLKTKRVQTVEGS